MRRLIEAQAVARQPSLSVSSSNACEGARAVAPAAGCGSALTVEIRPPPCQQAHRSRTSQVETAGRIQSAQGYVHRPRPG